MVHNTLPTPPLSENFLNFPEKLKLHFSGFTDEEHFHFWNIFVNDQDC